MAPHEVPKANRTKTFQKGLYGNEDVQTRLSNTDPKGFMLFAFGASCGLGVRCTSEEHLDWIENHQETGQRMRLASERHRNLDQHIHRQDLDRWLLAQENGRTREEWLNKSGWAQHGGYGTVLEATSRHHARVLEWVMSFKSANIGALHF